MSTVRIWIDNGARIRVTVASNNKSILIGKEESELGNYKFAIPTAHCFPVDRRRQADVDLPAGVISEIEEIADRKVGAGSEPVRRGAYLFSLAAEIYKAWDVYLTEWSRVYEIIDQAEEYVLSVNGLDQHEAMVERQRRTAITDQIAGYEGHFIHKTCDEWVKVFGVYAS